MILCLYLLRAALWPAPNATMATGRTENLHRQNRVSSAKKAPFQKIWFMHLHSAIWNFLLPDQPKDSSTTEKPCLNFSCCPGSTVTTCKVLQQVGHRRASAFHAVPSNPIWAFLKWAPVSPDVYRCRCKTVQYMALHQKRVTGHGYGERGVYSCRRPFAGGRIQHACVRTTQAFMTSRAIRAVRWLLDQSTSTIYLVGA